ncbi:MAG: excinuclease ABC subunit A [Ignavibacteriae bacterium]|nr:excinuclease ABC subunit A [Ignavibacteriota bacterium]
MDNQNKIVIKGAREHNLKNIDLEIPRDSLTVITGLSGSGKSSLAFDTIYAEGQRRYIESLSAYARQFLNLLEKPDVDLIEGLSPAISIEQKSTSGNPRSTVGTVTEIYDYLRLLYARVGKPYCYNCGRPVEKQSSEQIINTIIEKLSDEKISIFAPVVRGRKGHYRELFEDIMKDGFNRVRVDGEIVELEKGYKVDRYKIHNIEIVIDRNIKIAEKSRFRLSGSIEVALNYGSGTVIINSGNEDTIFSRNLACHHCGISYPELAPNSFSFNSPYGSCKDCDGLGEKRELDLDLIIPDWNKSINEEGIIAIGKPRNIWFFNQLQGVADKFEFTYDTPLKDLNEEQREVLLNGSKEKIPFSYSYGSSKSITYMHKFTGVINYIKHYYETTSSNKIREWAESFMNTQTCSTCNGGRLRPESLAVKFNEKNITEVTSLSIERAAQFFEKLNLTEREQVISNQILKEIRSRLKFLLDVGLDYLTLNRSARTLSGGEAQRIRLATQIGSQLAGVLYVLDEPSIGLHQSDNVKLIESLKNLRDLGNTIVVVEHDRETIESSDYIIDLGPRAGEHGGEVCLVGETNQIVKSKNGFTSLTMDYLKNRKKIETPNERRSLDKGFIEIKGAKGNNLKNVDLKIPLGTFTAITGVSGSGKSSLINETLVRILSKDIYQSKVVPLKYDEVLGLDNIDKVIEIDQSPIGRTPRSNPATYTGLFTFIRDLFAQLPESKVRGYAPGRFSFNVKGGRCEECQGDGLKKIEMNFLPNVYVLCEVCNGKRYNRETLEVLYKTKSISDVLEMTVEEALTFFDDLPRIKRKIKSLNDVGLGYVKLGQQATTLSGGEAQRVKLATELSKVSTGKTIYILDEPTTGLHFEDVNILLKVLNKLVTKGNTVVVVEHNLDVIKFADYVIDLGPGGGEHGGKIIAEGTPEEIIKNKKSLTGKFLKAELER